MFFPMEQITRLDTPPAPITDAVVVPEISGNDYSLSLSLPSGDVHNKQRTVKPEDDAKLTHARLLYEILMDITGRKIDWGILTGIRPVKIARTMRTQGLSSIEVEEKFIEDFLTTPEKAHLCTVTDSVQRSVVESTSPKDYSLYISIPFCPSRCSYCSFVSHSIEKTIALLPEYVEKLVEELVVTAQVVKEKKLTLRTVYMGGGTPTVLNAQQLETVISTVHKHFDMSACEEFTVEAGRPDTITADKLAVMERLGVDRISVNCQTLNDQVLENIGRKHSAEDFLRAYELVRQYNIASINVDLIAGLPGDDYDSFCATLEKVISLSPENITIHTLTIKRAARLVDKKESITDFVAVKEAKIPQMVNFSQNTLDKFGYLPYYLYRQKGTADSLENVGFSRGDTICKYNVFIMDETHSIISVGGGGVTKIVMPMPDGTQLIQRLFNHKFPYEYISRFDEILARKHAILDYNI